MNNPDRMKVFKELKPYLRLITAFNHDNFHRCYWQCTQNVKSACCALCAILIIVAIPIPVILGIWKMFEINDLIKNIATIPLLATLLEMDLAFIALIFKSRIVIDMIDRLQKVIDKSEYKFSVNFRYFPNGKG